MQPIPFLDLYASNRPVETAFFRELRKLYRKSAFIGGPHVEAFEKSFARACGARHCVAVSNGTAALHLSLAAAGVGAGDEVIVPAFTFPGAAGPVLQRGARVVFADVRPHDGCLDPRAVARAVTPRTKAILVTHLFGHAANLDGLRKALSGKGARRILFIEDAAQAHGGSWRGRPLGSLGDFGCFSFYPTKNLGGIGDAGAILVKSAAAAARLRRLRDHGQALRFHPEEAGFNARMDALQALFLSLKLPRLGRDNARRASVAAGFLKALEGSRALRALTPPAEGVSAWHAFVVVVSGGATRAAFLRHLDAAGIGHQVYYPRALPALKAFRAFAAPCPAAEDLARRVVALPLHPGLDARQQARIRAALASFRPSSRLDRP